MSLGACACCGTAGDRPAIGDPPDKQRENDVVELPSSLPSRRVFLCRRCTKLGVGLFARARRFGFPAPPKRLA